MNMKPLTKLADTQSAVKVDTVDYAQMTTGTECAIRSAVRDLVVGHVDSESLAINAICRRFHGHLVAIAKKLWGRFDPGIRSRLPSPSELVQEAFIESRLRTKLIRNLSNLRRDHGEGFAMRNLVKYVSSAADLGFRDALADAAKRIARDESELRFLGELERIWDNEAREAEENERRWALVEQYLRTRYQEDELEGVRLRFEHHESFRSIAETVRAEMPASRFAGPERRIEVFCAQVVKDMKAYFEAESLGE